MSQTRADADHKTFVPVLIMPHRWERWDQPGAEEQVMQPRTPPGRSQSTTVGRVVQREATACRTPLCAGPGDVPSPWSHEQVLELWGTGSEGRLVTG